MTELAPSNPVQDLVLGTVQLGVPYGIANRTGMPVLEQALFLITEAFEAGVCIIDTARAYGESEARIGLCLGSAPSDIEVITKLSPLDGLNYNSTTATIEKAVRTDVEDSLALLELKTLDCLLVHRAEHLTAWDGKVWSLLQTLVDEGKIKRIGASVQTVDEARTAFGTEDLGHIQLPLNLLDHRWREAGLDALAKARPDVRVHARSLYLQGLLVAGDPDLFPSIEGFDENALVDILTRSVTDFGRDSLADLCLAWARSLDWVDGLVIGMETSEQLKDNLKLFASDSLTEKERLSLEARMPRVPETLLNPALWPRDTSGD